MTSLLQPANAPTAWLEFHITVLEQDISRITEQLAFFEADAVTFLDAGNQPIYEPTQSTPRIWPETIVIGLFNQLHDLDTIRLYLEKEQQAGWIKKVEQKTFPDEDWVRRSLDQFQPMCFGKRLWICPSWHLPPDPSATNVILDPGLAFGTGTHATTALCLEWLDQHVDSPSLVIDYGSGSGILGISALKLGAKKLYAVDNDPEAIVATQINAQRNDVYPSVSTYFPGELPEEQADILIANILAEPLLALAPRFAELTKPNGVILLSGILAENVQNMTNAYKPWYIMQQPVFKGEWVLLVGIRANNN